MNVSRRQLLTGAAALATAGGLRARRAWAQAPTAAAAPQKGGQIIVGITQEAQNFNPAMPTIETQRGVHMAIFDDLWRIDGKGNFVPNLALTIPTQSNGGISRDGTLFTVKLRPGVTWHDGQPFTARDVMFTWKTIMNPAVTAFSTVGFDQIADMWAADDTTLKWKMKQPYAPIADLYVDPSTSYETNAPKPLLPMFQDKRMRQALYLAMDKKPIVEKIWLRLAPEAESYVPPQSWAYNPKIKGRHTYDPERAKTLLDEIGWKVGADGIRVKGGTRLSFENACTAGNKQREQIQQLLQQQWRQVGVEMKINNKPAAVLFGDFYRMSKFETIVIGMAMGSDPEHSFRLHSKYIPAKGGMGRNSVASESPEIDRLLEAGVRDIDREKRKKAYFRLQEVYADELPYLPIFHYVNIRGTRKGVQGFAPNSNMQEYSWNTNEWWIKKG